MTRSPDTLPIDLPRGWRLTLRRFRRSLRERSRQVVEAGESGERLVAKVRLLSLALLALIQLTPLLELDSVPAQVAFHSQEAVVGRCLTGSGLMVAILLWLAIRYAYRPWMGLFSIFLDVTMVSAGLAVFFALNRPLTAVNSRVVFEVYFLAIASAGLRYDWRLCVAATVLAVTEYLGIALYAVNHWDLAAAFEAESSYGAFGWSGQIGRMIVLIGAGVTGAAVALRGHQWRHLSGKDALTGLANRAWFEERLEEEMSRARRGGQPLSLAVVDLDSFRELNGAHGHAGGDLALQTVARRLRHSIRKSDLAARLGGDEFVIVFPDTDVAQAVLRLDSLRQEVAGLRVQTGRTAFTVTMSVGVASFPVDGSSTAEVLAAADARAFEAKHLGKNRVVGPQRVVGPPALAASDE
ncbi:MAG: GGDEF domain-containing protein [Myxococcaceae bacterium]|nr:MAG: GGDEF domain-containing protein [Myxococcaceae bacterium]